MRFLLLNLLSIVFAFGCARAPIKSAQEAMRLAPAPMALHDDLPTAELIEGIQKNIRQLKWTKGDDGFLQFGPRKVLAKEYIQSLEHFVTILKTAETPEQLAELTAKDFDFYEVYGKKEWGDAYITSYFTPLLKGSRKKTKRFSRPLYSMPNDLVLVDVEKLAGSRAEFSRWKKLFKNRKLPKSMQARVTFDHKAGVLPIIEPFFNRKEIDEDGKLKGKKLELAWVDPVDAFFFHIQGSGIVEFPNKKRVVLRYSSQNGRPYTAIGRFLKEEIPEDKMSLHSIDRHLRNLGFPKAQELMNKNESYVFFEKTKDTPLTKLGTNPVAGRTIATDWRLFPKGTLAYLKFDKPQFSTEEATEPSHWEPISRFVLDQDTGGAIRGPHRVDLYWGQGAKAKQAAGVMKHWGRLQYLVPKEKLLISWRKPVEKSLSKSAPKGK